MAYFIFLPRARVKQQQRYRAVFFIRELHSTEVDTKYRNNIAKKRKMFYMERGQSIIGYRISTIECPDFPFTKEAKHEGVAADQGKIRTLSLHNGKGLSIYYPNFSIRRQMNIYNVVYA